MTPIRVLIVDDHEIFTHSLVRLLETTPGFNVVGSARTVEAGVAATSSHRPDVVLMDFELPDGDGATATERIKAETPSVKVVMLTARTDEAALVRAIESGCSGFVKKEEAIDSLLAAIVAAHEGDIIVSSTPIEALLAKLPPTNRGLASDLTAREHEILVLSAAGLANKEIAERLELSHNTVRNHGQNILYKLDAHSKLEAVATAVREGIIQYPRVG